MWLISPDIELIIITTDSYLLAVDKEAKNTTIDLLTNGVEIRLADNQKELDTWFKIIAHQPLHGAKPLDGVWELPELNKPLTADQIIDNHLNLVGPTNFDVYSNRDSVKEAMIMYHKASCGYTKEDMQRAMMHCMDYGLEQGESTLSQKLSYTNLYISRLTPTPIGFKVKMVAVDENDFRGDFEVTPKVIGNQLQGNFIY